MKSPHLAFALVPSSTAIQRHLHVTILSITWYNVSDYRVPLDSVRFTRSQLYWHVELFSYTSTWPVSSAAYIIPEFNRKFQSILIFICWCLLTIMTRSLRPHPSTLLISARIPHMVMPLDGVWFRCRYHVLHLRIPLSLRHTSQFEKIDLPTLLIIMSIPTIASRINVKQWMNLESKDQWPGPDKQPHHWPLTRHNSLQEPVIQWRKRSISMLNLN